MHRIRVNHPQEIPEALEASEPSPGEFRNTCNTLARLSLRQNKPHKLSYINMQGLVTENSRKKVDISEM